MIVPWIIDLLASFHQKSKRGVICYPFNGFVPLCKTDYAHALNRNQQKIEAMQNTICILEIQINTKAIQNCNEI